MNYEITKARMAGEFSVLSGALALAWELLYILLRFLNIGFLNLRPKLFIAIVSFSDYI